MANIDLMMSTREYEKGLIFQKGLVVGAYENAVGDECTELSPLGQKIDDQLGGKLRNALNG